MEEVDPYVMPFIVVAVLPLCMTIAPSTVYCYALSTFHLVLEMLSQKRSRLWFGGGALGEGNREVLKVEMLEIGCCGDGEGRCSHVQDLNIPLLDDEVV